MSTIPEHNALMKFGFTFHKLTVAQLKAICDEESLHYYLNDKKYDLLFKVEKHFADERLRNRVAPTKYLDEDFSTTTLTVSELRQILVQHNISYYTDKATKEDLQLLFEEHRDAIYAMHFPPRYQASQQTNGLEPLVNNMNLGQSTPAQNAHPNGSMQGPMYPRRVSVPAQNTRARAQAGAKSNNNQQSIFRQTVATQAPPSSNHGYQAQMPPSNNGQQSILRQMVATQTPPSGGQEYQAPPSHNHAKQAQTPPSNNHGHQSQIPPPTSHGYQAQVSPLNNDGYPSLAPPPNSHSYQSQAPPPNSHEHQTQTTSSNSHEYRTQAAPPITDKYQTQAALPQGYAQQAPSKTQQHLNGDSEDGATLGSFNDPQAMAAAHSNDRDLGNRVIEGFVEQNMARAVQAIQGQNVPAALELLQELVSDLETITSWNE